MSPLGLVVCNLCAVADFAVVRRKDALGDVTGGLALLDQSVRLQQPCAASQPPEAVTRQIGTADSGQVSRAAHAMLSTECRLTDHKYKNITLPAAPSI